MPVSDWRRDSSRLRLAAAIEALDAREIEAPCALGGMLGEQITRLGAHWHRRFRAQRHLPGKAKILGHQIDQETALIIIGA